MIRLNLSKLRPVKSNVVKLEMKGALHQVYSSDYFRGSYYFRKLYKKILYVKTNGN